MTNERPTHTRKYKTKYKPQRKAYIVRLPLELARVVDLYAGVFTSDDYKQRYGNTTLNDVLTAIFFDTFFEYDDLNMELYTHDALRRIGLVVPMIDDIDNIIWDLSHTVFTDDEITRFVDQTIERERSAQERIERITQSVNKIVTKRDAWGAGDDEKLQEVTKRIHSMLEAKRQQGNN